MQYPRRAALLAALFSLAACHREPPRSAPPSPPAAAAAPVPAPAAIGVHVASAPDSTAHARFTVTVAGSLELGIRAPFFAMRPDRSLILSTPADLLVNKGAGSAVIAATDPGAVLVVTSLAGAGAGAAATARGHAVRIERAGAAGPLTAAPLSTPEVKR